MSLPKRLYESYRNLCNSQLVVTLVNSVENMGEFELLLNNVFPINEVEYTNSNLTKLMYYSNPAGFMRYISDPLNKVGALVLYTESKQIVKHFRLNGCVHISWDKTTKLYKVSAYEKRERKVRPPTEKKYGTYKQFYRKKVVADAASPPKFSLKDNENAAE
jgi:hypothetical protein